MTERMGMGDYIASLPYLRGYELDNHVVAVGQHDGIVQVSGSINWDDVKDRPDPAEAFADVVRRRFPEVQADHVAVIGFGPHGAERAVATSAAIRSTSNDFERVTTWAADAGQYQQLEPARGPLRPLPSPSGVFLAEGYGPPAASQEAMMRRYRPLPEPAFEPLDTAKASRLDATPPSARADIANRALDRLANGERGPDTESLRPTLAHAVSRDTAVRDAVIASAVQSTAKSAELVETFRGAPEESRSTLAAMAAISSYASGRTGNVAASTMLESTDPNDNLGRLAGIAVGARLPGPAIRAMLKDADKDLDEADSRWHSQRVSAARSPVQAAFPNPPGVTRADNSPQPRPHQPGPTIGPSIEPER